MTEMEMSLSNEKESGQANTETRMSELGLKRALT